MPIKTYLAIYEIQKGYPPIKKLIYRHESESFLKNFLAGLATMFRTLDNIYPFKDILGTTYNCYRNIGVLSIANGAATPNNGIVVGRSNVPVKQSDFKLDDKIAHGSAVGQLVHNAQTWSALQGTESLTFVTVARTFSNATASSITIAETGIYAKLHSTSTQDRDVCIVRDIISPYPVPATKTIEIEYTIEVSL